MEKVLRSRLRHSNMVEESSDPGYQNPEHYKHEKRRSNVVHDSLEVALILGSLNKVCSTADERLFGSGLNKGKGLTSFAASGVVDHITQIFFNSQRLAGNSRLINGCERAASIVVWLLLMTVLMGIVFCRCVMILFFVCAIRKFIFFIAAVEFIFGSETFVKFKIFGACIVADKASICSDGTAFLNNELRH